MAERSYYQDSTGMKITQEEVVWGLNKKDDEPDAIPLDQIDMMVVQTTRDWKPGLGFFIGGVILLLLGSGWAYLFALASMAWGAYILAHPSHRLYRLFVGMHAGTIGSFWPLKRFQGQDGRLKLEEIVEAFNRAKEDAVAGPDA